MNTDIQKSSIPEFPSQRPAPLGIVQVEAWNLELLLKWVAGIQLLDRLCYFRCIMMELNWNCSTLQLINLFSTGVSGDI